MRADQGYQFCPWCGLKLEIKHHCDHCGKDFISEEAYHVHLHGLQVLKSNPCPNDTKTIRHGVRYLKYRNKMYCPECRIEYPVKTPEYSKHEAAGAYA